MKSEKIKAWHCPQCNANTSAEDGVPEVEDMWACGECGEIYEDKEEAKECFHRRGKQ